MIKDCNRANSMTILSSIVWEGVQVTGHPLYSSVGKQFQYIISKITGDEKTRYNKKCDWQMYCGQWTRNFTHMPLFFWSYSLYLLVNEMIDAWSNEKNGWAACAWALGHTLLHPWLSVTSMLQEACTCLHSLSHANITLHLKLHAHFILTQSSHILIAPQRHGKYGI